MINPIKNPNGEQHHTEILAIEEDMATGLILGTFLGGLFVDKHDHDDPDRPLRESYFYNEMTSTDCWTRVARALRFHALKIVSKHVGE